MFIGELKGTISAKWYEMHYKLLAKPMHDVSNDLVL